MELVAALAVDPMMVRERSIEDVFAAASIAGYRAVELSPREDFLPAGREPRATNDVTTRLRRASHTSGIKVVSMAAFYDWSSPDPDTRTTAAGWFRMALQVANDIGCPTINTELKGDPLRASESEAAFRRSLDELLPTAEDLGIRIAVEPHPYDFMEESDGAVDLVRSVGSSTLGYLFCAPHMFIMGSDPRHMIAYAGPDLIHVHLADTLRPSQFITNPAGTGVRVHQHLDIGLGEVPWPDVCSALASSAYQGAITIAVFAHAERADDSFRRNHDRVLELLRSAASGDSSPTQQQVADAGEEVSG